jgi:DNA repair photolyase
MIVREIRAKSVLSASKVYDYVVNPYVGCEHGCSYCYARFMKRFSGHPEPWGQFVDVKINAPELLGLEIKKKKRGRVWVSGVCDPYQPIEWRYKLTRACLEILVENGWPVVVQTRSPLVLRDRDILQKSADLEVGMSVTTALEKFRKIFEPAAPPIRERIRALGELHRAGVRTFVMIAPMLPGAGILPLLLKGKVDYILIDKMNYNYANWVYRKYQIEEKGSQDFFSRDAGELKSNCVDLGLDCRLLF